MTNSYIKPNIFFPFSIGREEKWEPGYYSSVCSLHFSENDFQIYSKDNNKSRIQRMGRGMVSQSMELTYLVNSLFLFYKDSKSEASAPQVENSQEDY